MSNKRYSAFVLYKRVLLQVRPYWLYLALLVFLGLLATPIALLMPLPLKIAVDSVIGSEPLPGFLRIVVPASLVKTKGSGHHDPKKSWQWFGADDTINRDFQRQRHKKRNGGS